MKRSIRYITWALVVIIVLVLSFKVEKLDDYRASHASKAFNATDYALDVWDNKLPGVIRDAPEIIALIDLLKTDPEQAFDTYGRKLGISDTWYFMTRGEGIIDAVEDEFLLVDLNGGQQVRVATSFIFGNAVRDGSGVVDIDDFVNMTDFNNVSVDLDRLVKERVVSVLKNSASRGMKLEFTGAFEFNDKTGDPDTVRVIPVSVRLSNG